MSAMTHEIEHRWGVSLKFVHPTKGADGLDAYDLLGRDAAHWSYFVNAALPPAQFGGVPRCPGMEGNAIVDLGTPATWNGFPTNLAPGERVFQTPPDQLMEGCGELDQYLMGLRRASEVAPFWYVDEPVSIRTGQSLDVFNPTNPLSSSDSMRVWLPQGGIAFKGRRVDLTIQSIKDYEKLRERSENPKGNLRVRYFRDTRQVDPAGDASVTLSEADRELGDEADRIGPDGKPVDVKTVAFILVVPSGDPGSHNAAIGRLDEFRRTWEAYINGPGTAGRGRFDTRLDPPVW
jgi:hypothetical protein